MGKGEKTSKALEAVYKLSFQKDFRKDLNFVRLICDVPLRGYENGRQDLPKMPNSILSKSLWLLHRYKLPVTYFYEMSQYIAFNNFNIIEKRKNTYVEICYPNNSPAGHNREGVYKKLKLPYVGLYIFDTSSKDAVIGYICKNWSEIKRSLGAQGANFSRIRKSDNKERNHLIASLHRLSIIEICNMVGWDPEKYKFKSKDVVIQNAMVNHFEYSKVTLDIIRKYRIRSR